MECKILKKKIDPFMSFGKMPMANGFLNKEDFNNEFFYELKVGFSEDVSLLQLNDHPSPKQMFNKKYPFYTGSSEFMKSHFKKYANWINKYLKNFTHLIEIGSNDGTFLNNFRNSNLNLIGFEPSENVALKAKNNGINTINDFFCLNSIDEIKKFHNNTDIICAANVICHIPDLNDLIRTIDKLLKTKGLFVFEEPYLGAMFEKTSYDQIYDEHIYLFSASSIKKIFSLYEMELIDLFPQTTHGGSMRYVVCRKGKR